MSGPTRQRSLKDRLKDGIGLSLQRRRSTQSTSSVKTGKPYVIPTGNKTKSAESHDCPSNPFEWNSMNKKNVVSIEGSEDMLNVQEQQQQIKDSDHKHLFKSASEADAHHDIPLEKEKKQVARTMTQPIGTITYTVQSSDTLTSIAARFDTTPSELVKLNRLVSRLIFPGQVLYVPDKSSNLADICLYPEGSSAALSQMKQENDECDSQSSPKPGHVERIQSPVLSPTVHTLTEEEERNLDRECIEKFLKINVRHITDGQGVVNGVLLVTPNNVMFDPNVSDPLVIEHGPEKYGVIAPMDYVINAAMYNDIATMFVSHIPDRQVQTQPEIYHAKECLLSWPTGSTVLSHRPSGSDSEQAVNGSVSDMAEVGTPEEERASLSSCQTYGGNALQTSDSVVNLDPEVFLEETISSILSDGGGDGGSTTFEKEQSCKTSSDNLDNLQPDIVQATNFLIKGVIHSDDAEDLQSDSPACVCVIADNNDKGLGLEGTTGSSEQPCNRAAAAAPSEQPTDDNPEADRVLKESLTRKHSSPLDSKMKVLKRLSYPLTWMESFGGGEKENDVPLSLSSLTDIPNTTSVASSTVTTAATMTTTITSQSQSTFSKILSSSPRTLVDFSTGLFAWSSDEAGVPRPPGDNVEPIPTQPSPLSTIEEDKGETKGSDTLVSLLSDNGTMPATQQKLDAVPQVVLKKRTSTDDKKSPSGTGKEPKVGFKSIVSVDDMPDLFASIDLLGNSDDFELIPRPAKPCDDPPLYLCLRMGTPVKKTTKNIPAMAYGKKRMKREYWFSIPRDRVDDLYSFFNHWAPNVYGELDEESIRQRGFELIESEEELSDGEHQHDSNDYDEELNVGDNSCSGKAYSDWEIMKAPHMKLFARLRRDTGRTTDSFEVITSLDLKKQMSLELELPLPDLIGKTDILTEDHRKTITKHLPARAVGYAWSLIFSTSQHGFSLNNLYRKMQNFETPVLLVIVDTDNNVFGALTSCSIRISDHFYGTGESFLFSFYPEFNVFKWSGENMYFIKGNIESLAIGAGDGVFGLWLDGDLYHGRSHPCKTYNNLTLSSKEDFFVKTLEAWGFIEVDTTSV